MPYFKVEGILHHKGKVYRDNDEVEMSAELAAKLKGTVFPLELTDPDKPLDKMTLKELQTVAQKANLEGYSKFDKKSLYAALTGTTVPETEEQAVTVDDESDSD